MTKLSEQLSALSSRVASMEDRANQFKSESQAKRDEKIAAIQADVEAKRAKFESDIRGIGDKVSATWAALGEDLKSRTSGVRTAIETRKEAIDLKRAQNRADRLTENADAALAFVALAIVEAELAVVEAVDAQLHAESLS